MTTLSVPTALRCICLFICSIAAAPGQVILVNIADPAAVTFTGTGTFASANYNGGTTAALPVRLQNFFSSAPGNLDVTATLTTLMTTGANHTLGLALLRPGASGATTLDFRQAGFSQENFSTSSAAFSGTGTFNFSTYGAYLPAAGTTGNIFAADGATVIGTYSVVSSAVPEPSAYAALCGLVTLGLSVYRRRACHSPPAP